MITIEEALERILAYVSVLPAEEKHPLDALGQVLDEDITATFDIPPLDNTSMDGYAVRAPDTAGASEASPRELRVIGEVAAGYIYDGEVTDGAAVRIMTGAPIPRGADAVVPFEETDEETAHSHESVRVFKEAQPGANIRPAGQDVRTGDVVLRKGAVLRPQEIGVIASLGRDRVRVIRRPVVAVLSTGDELLEPGQPREGARIYDANAYSIAALVQRFGGVPKLLGIAKDTVEALTARIHEGLDADMLVTSAGVSKGDYDIVKDVLAREGEVAFWTVAVKPGKPLAFGAFERDGRRIPHIGLPGNPVSSMVAFELFGRPAILKMMGKTGLPPPDRAGDRGRPHHEHRRPARLPGPLRRHRARRTLLRPPHRRAGLRHPDVDGARQRPDDHPRRRRRRRAGRRDRRADAGLVSRRRAGFVPERIVAICRSGPPP